MSRIKIRCGRILSISFAIWGSLANLQIAWSQIPDHPIIAEVYSDPLGTNDGPVGRDPGSQFQEYIEIYLPPLSSLNPSLNKDALRMTYYEIQGNSGNSQRGSVNQRFDLPAFDLDPGNGITPGALARPSSGVIILGWVDYNTAVPPTALAGTPSSRVGLINGGITTSPPGALFIAMNGAEFGGTTNFPVPVAESLIDLITSRPEYMNGVMDNGSSVYLLVDRDNPDYVQLEDRKHPELGSSFADLPSGANLGIGCLLDGIAGNDDPKFRVSDQPYVAPTGLNIDLEDVLPSGGAFSLWVAQIAKAPGRGYARRFIDELRTTEDAIVGNENPATDAKTRYRLIFNDGPFYPTPGTVSFTTQPPVFSAAQSSRHTFHVLANSTGRPGMISANVGGNYPINISIAVGASSNPAVATFASDANALGVLGQTEALPQIAVTVPAGVADGATATSALSFTATNMNAGDPPVINPNQSSVATVTVLNPTTGIDELVPPNPLQATIFIGVEGLGASPSILNEFASTSLAGFLNNNWGTKARDSLNHGALLLNSSTNLEDYATVNPLQLSFPSSQSAYINAAGPAGHKDLAQTVIDSAKVRSGSPTYSASINSAQTAIKAVHVPIPETSTHNGTFAATETIFFADEIGNVADLRSGLSNVTTARTFELAMLDTNVTSVGLESGDSDDFGLVVRVGRVSAGAAVVPGEFVFLSFSGGLQGEDIDTLDVPGANATNVIFLDLDNLSTVLGCETINDLYVVDGGDNGTVNIIEAFSLNLDVACTLNSQCDDGNPCNGTEICNAEHCQAGTPLNCDDGLFCTGTETCNPAQGCVHSGNPCIDPANCNEAGHFCTGELTPVQPDPSGIDKNRYIAFQIPPSGVTAIQIKRVKLQRPSPPNLPQFPPPNFSAFENQFSYAGTPTKHCQNGGVPPCAVPSDAIFDISVTQCAANYINWQTALAGGTLFV
ncbi:MAG: hypothetical protein HY287_11010, partial [Planctomycetes bacterium]|nr:hypothetical protein [Planctomycetota bacterium]